MMFELPVWQLALLSLIFVWTGFVRSALGFGGAALSLPFMLLILPDPLLFLPMIGFHLLFFSGLTLFNRLHNVDWLYLRSAIKIMALPMAVGILGLLNLSSDILTVLVFSITLFYALTYLFNYQITSNNRWIDAALLILGGYVAGTSLIGAPLIVAVFIRHIAPERLRDTLFVLWIIFVLIKMIAFGIAEVNLQFVPALIMLPIAAIGHFAGLKAHDAILATGGVKMKRIIGAVLASVTIFGLYRVLAVTF